MFLIENLACMATLKLTLVMLAIIAVIASILAEFKYQLSAG
jgi:hypothetical protein